MGQIKIAVGEEGFANFRETGSYYVDKTNLIYELLNATNNKVTLFTRPRRFGKTLMMSTIANFFDITKDSSDIFKGLAVAEHEEFCRKWMNQYPVLFVSFQNAEGADFSAALEELGTVLANVCKAHPYLGESSKVDSDDKRIFARLKAKEAEISDIKSSLLTLMRMMSAHFGKKVILLIDEYDVPLASASENHYYSQMLDIIRAIFKYSVKSNRLLQFAVVTGCLRIAKESIFTGTNNFASYSILDEAFGEYFGFSQAEVNTLLDKAGIAGQEDIIKNWYDGYVFGQNSVYCPWDVANYISDYLMGAKGLPKNYWANTSHNAIIETFVGRKEFINVPEKFETLMNGGTIRQTIVDNLTYDALHGSENNLWSVLVMAGYLTKANKDEFGDTIELRIPNKEIEALFRKSVVDHFKASLDQTKLRDMMQALWDGDDAKATEFISDFLWNTISYNNYHEDFYHAFLAGILAGLGYTPQTDKEHGLGRPDIVLKDRENRRVLIIEVKKASEKSSMESTCNDALQQIADRHYADDQDLDGYTSIVCYGISFFKKSALVKKLTAH